MRALLCAVILLLFGPAMAQEHRHGPGQSPGHPLGHSPYAGLENRATKALSEQQLVDLRAGRGMGLALAAELNGYPGPLHVLELGEQLMLSAEQRQRAV